MVTPEELSPTQRLFNQLCQDIAPSPDQISGLIGKEVFNCNRPLGSPGYGFVKKVVGDRVNYVPYVGRKQLTVTAKYLTPSSDTFYLIHDGEPDSIWIRPQRSWYPDAQFVPEDRALNEILGPALAEFPKIETTADIRRLTVWILRNVRHRPSWVDPSKDDGKILGEAIRDLGAVCRHYAAAEYAVLRLRGVKVNYVSSDTGKYKALDSDGLEYTEEHAFLETFPTDGPMLITDPNSHLVLPLEGVLKDFKGSEKMTAFYKNYQKVTPEGKWVPRAV